MNNDQLQQQAELAAQYYYQVTHNPSSTIFEIKKAEDKVMLATAYLADRFCRKYRRDLFYPELKQEAYQAIVEALRTYDPSKSDCFTYWATFYSVRVRRLAVKLIKKNLYTQSLEITAEKDATPSIFDKDRQLNPEQYYQIKEALSLLSKEELQLLHDYFDLESIRDLAAQRKQNRGTIYNQLRRIINKIKL